MLNSKYFMVLDAIINILKLIILCSLLVHKTIDFYIDLVLCNLVIFVNSRRFFGASLGVSTYIIMAFAN